MKGFQLCQIEFFWRKVFFQLFIITIKAFPGGHVFLNSPNHFQEVFRIKHPGILEVNGLIGIEKNRIGNSRRLVFQIDPIVDISIDEDINKMPVEVLINLFLPQGFAFKHFTPVAPFRGKKQKQWLFTVRILFQNLRRVIQEFDFRLIMFIG